MRSDGDVKSFFRQQKARPGAAATKPAGGVSKKAAQHPQKQAAALLRSTPGKTHSPPRPIPCLTVRTPSLWSDPSGPGWTDAIDLMLLLLLLRQITSTALTRGGRRRTGRGRHGSSTWTCATGPASASPAPSAGTAPPRSASPRRRTRSAPTTSRASGKAAARLWSSATRRRHRRILDRCFYLKESELAM